MRSWAKTNTTTAIQLATNATGPLRVERPRWLRSVVDAVDYRLCIWVSVNDVLAVGAPDESVPVTVTVTVLGRLPGVPQPVNRLRPITLAPSRTISCRVRRFLKPKQQRATANVAPPGNSGKEWFDELPPEETVSADTPGTPTATATADGLKEQRSPGGNPLQLRLTVPTYPFTELTDMLRALALPPGLMVTIAGVAASVKVTDTL